MFAEKLQNYDRIEGYNSKDPTKGLYMRDVVTAHLLDSNGNETGETLQTHMYHRKGIRESEPIPNGDWMQRDRSKDAQPCTQQ